MLRQKLPQEPPIQDPRNSILEIGGVIDFRVGLADIRVRSRPDIGERSRTASATFGSRLKPAANRRNCGKWRDRGGTTERRERGIGEARGPESEGEREKGGGRHGRR